MAGVGRERVVGTAVRIQCETKPRPEPSIFKSRATQGGTIPAFVLVNGTCSHQTFIMLFLISLFESTNGGNLTGGVLNQIFL